MFLDVAGNNDDPEGQGLKQRGGDNKHGESVMSANNSMIGFKEVFFYTKMPNVRTLE